MTTELGPLDRDITGGYLQGGPAGNLKMTHPTAFSIALLAWGLIQFPSVRPPPPALEAASLVAFALLPSVFPPCALSIDCDSDCRLALISRCFPFDSSTYLRLAYSVQGLTHPLDLQWHHATFAQL